MVKKRSPVWNHFEEKDGYARCLVCTTSNKLIKLMPQGSTTNMLNHLRKHHNLEITNNNSIENSFQEQIFEQHIPQKPANPLDWLHFDKLGNDAAQCRLCLVTQAFDFESAESYRVLMIHLAQQHPVEYKELFNTDAEVFLATMVANVENQLNEPENGQVEIKKEPLGNDAQIAGSNQQEGIFHNQLINEASVLPPQQQPNEHHVVSLSQRNNRASPTPCSSRSTVSPPEEKRSRLMQTGCGDNYATLGKLVGEELQWVADAKPGVALKYSIVIHEVLTKMKREMLELEF